MINEKIGAGIIGVADFGELYYDSAGLFLRFTYLFR
jgi:hypothetical protein